MVNEIHSQRDSAEPNEPLRFSLSTLFIAIAAVSLILGLGQVVGYGWAMSLALPPTITFAVANGSVRDRTIKGAVAACFVGMMALLFVPAVVVTRSPGRRASCANNLRELALALLTYKDRNGRFPPPYIADRNGKPMHSWRVLILPYLEQQALYDAYNFDEPWDGPNNRKLHDIVLHVFGCDPRHDDLFTATNYVAVVGPGTIWDVNANGNANRPEDSLSDTILLVEVANSGIHWMEPRDLYLGQMASEINPERGQGISSTHKTGANAAFADGRIELLPTGMKRHILDGLLSRNGGEVVPPEDEWTSGD